MPRRPGRPPQFPCGLCGKRYNRKDNLLRHQRLECGKAPQFKCPHCHHRTKRRDNILSHSITDYNSITVLVLLGFLSLVNDVGKGPLHFLCGDCGRHYNRKDNLQRHQRLECGQQPQLECPHCPHRVKRKDKLKTHIALKHPEEYRGNLLREMQGNATTAELQEPQQFPCERCGRRYSRKYNLQRHVRLECGKEPQQQCPHCPHRAKRRNDLRTHVFLKHADQCQEMDLV
ncbi:hypothetical protein J6590_014856 [Homalodisca vitripennis]|nr:hypothetical protein J6590_014856 [Homalodisca vitripennis]